MDFYKKVIEYKSRSEEFTVIPLGDVHYGAEGCDLKKFLATVEYIANKPNCYVILMGDYLDMILPVGNDKRFSLAISYPDNHPSI